MKNEISLNKKTILKTYLNFTQQSWQLCIENSNFLWTRTAKKTRKKEKLAKLIEKYNVEYII